MPKKFHQLVDGCLDLDHPHDNLAESEDAVRRHAKEFCEEKGIEYNLVRVTILVTNHGEWDEILGLYTGKLTDVSGA